MMQLGILEPGIEPAEAILSGLQLLVDVGDVRAEVGLDTLEIFFVAAVAGEAATALEGDLASVGIRLVALGRRQKLERLRLRFEIGLDGGEFDGLENVGQVILLVFQVEETRHPRGRAEPLRILRPVGDEVLLHL